MITVTTQDGAVFTGETARQVVSQMRQDNWNAPARKLEYMQEVAERVYQSLDREVRTESVEMFLGDLERVGMLSVSVTVTLSTSLAALTLDAIHSTTLIEPDLTVLSDLFRAALDEVGWTEGVA